MRILINSDDLTNTSNVYKINQSFSIPNGSKRLVINKIILPQSYYNVVSRVIRINSTTCSIADGQYDIASLTTAIQTAIRTGMSDATYTCTYSTTTLSVTIAHPTTAFTINNSFTSTISPMIGFSGTMTGAITYSSVTAYNIGLGVIGLNSDLLSKWGSVQVTTTNNNLVLYIPQNASPDAYLIYEPSYQIDYLFPAQTSIFGNCSFWFTYPDNSLIDFKNCPWYMEIEWI